MEKKLMSDDKVGELLVNMVFIAQTLTNEDFLKKQSGDVLSYTGVKLAAMKASLLDLKVAAHQEMLDKEVEMTQAKAAAYFKYKKEHGATAAGDMKYMDEDFVAATKAYNKAKVQFEKLKSVVADVHDLIDSIKSRVIDLQGARKDERLQ